MNLSRWNPFKFVRRHHSDSRSASGYSQQRASQPQPQQQAQPPQQQQGQSVAAGAQQMGAGTGTGMPQAWLDRGGLPDPLRMMATMMADPFGAISRLDNWFGDFSPEVFEPRIDVADRGDAIVITAELPGVDRNDVQVTLEDDYLLLAGEKKLEKKEEEKGVYRVERAFGSFQRVIPLPDGVDAKRAEAKFDNGTLTIRLPKAAGDSGGRRLEIGSSPGSATSGGRTAGTSQQG